ncbi:MAG: SPOR domain-containing protein [Desulfatitalea sp.]
MKNSILEWDRGSLLWGVIIALVVLIAAVAAAVKFLPKPTAPEPAPAIVRAKVPPLPPTEDKIETVDLRKANNEQALPAKTLEVQKPGPSDPTAIGKEVKAPSMPPAEPTPKIEPSATPPPVSATVAKPEAPPVKASTKTKVVEEKKKETSAGQIDLDKLAPFSIQVGAFRTKANADEIIAQLTQKGYAPFIFQVTDAQQRSFYMVRFGHFGTRDAAAQALADFTRKQKRSAVIVRSESM